MQIVRGLIIAASVLLVAWATWKITLWSIEFRDKFLFVEDWMGVVFLLALVLAIGAIFRWFLLWEVRASKVKRRRR